MSELSGRKCAPLAAGTPALNVDRIEALSKELDPGWAVSANGKLLSRTFEFRDFHGTMAFVNAVAEIAHAEDHHPDMEVGYNRCVVRYSTHSIGGLSENDFICAAKVDAI